MRVRVTEDKFGYGVMAEFGGMPAEAFEVELESNRVLITMAQPRSQNAPATSSCEPTRSYERRRRAAILTVASPASISA